MTLTEIRAALQSLGVRPRQSLGQNFLHDQNLARALAESLDGTHDGTIVEIGPGLGALTEHLIHHAQRLVLIEKDHVMARWLAEHHSSPQVELFHADALKFDLREICGGGRVAVIGNLPYYVSTPLIAKFASAVSPASTLVLTLQREVAGRICARPGSADFGAMSVCIQRRWEARIIRHLPPMVFYPEPKVFSAAVVLTRRGAEGLRPLDEGVFDDLVRRGFAERRKQLRKLLPELHPAWPDLCARLDMAEDIRAEALTINQWEELAVTAGPPATASAEELCDVVDAGDRVIESRPRQFVHVNNLRHRAVHILIFNAKGELFLQKRALWKELNPSLWDSSSAGHVDAGETYAQAASRELLEEIGATAPLEKIGRLEASQETSWEFVEIFRGHHEGPFRLARLEVEVGAFFPLRKIAGWIRARPQDFTPHFRRIFSDNFLEVAG